MIIDDDSDINNLFKIFLEHDGFQVDSYTNPIDALYYFKKNEYDLILLDLKMPQIDGISMFQALKKKDENVAICLITADLSYLEQLKEKIPNIEKYAIHKPILLRNLKDRINELLSDKSIKSIISLKIFELTFIKNWLSNPKDFTLNNDFAVRFDDCVFEMRR